MAQWPFPTVGDYPRLTSPGAATLQDQARELCGEKTHSSAADAESSQRRSGCLSVPMATKSPTFYGARYAGRSKFKLRSRRRRKRRRRLLIERQERWRPRRLGSSEFPKWQRWAGEAKCEFVTKRTDSGGLFTWSWVSLNSV